MKNLAALLCLSLALGACNRQQDDKPKVTTVPVARRDIVVDAEATGVVEPINVVEVKSKASGLIVRMPVETGAQVKPGDLLVQVDARDVRNQYDQAAADVRAAEARVEISSAQRKRADELYQQRVITAQEHEQARLDDANAEAQLVRARANLDLAKQRLEDATVTAPVAGTVIEKTVSLGQVITSATNAFGGGTTLLKMADLGRVRVRAMVNETDIGTVQAGQQARVTVDAYPERPFAGQVEKIEPQAVVQQSVTMFPVLVSVSNEERLLMPGMNGEVSILIDRRDNVLAIPNEAVRSPREATVAATALGLDPQAVQKQIQEQSGRRMSEAAGGAGGGGPTQVFMARGDVAPEGASAQQQQQQSGQREQGFQRQTIEVTQQQCDSVATAFAKSPDAQAKLNQLRDRVRSGEIDFQQMQAESQAIYASLKVDRRVAMACRARERGGSDMARPSGTAPADSASRAGRQGTQPRAQPGGQARSPALQSGAPEISSRGRARPGLVFVAENGTYVPKIVRLGVSNFDYTEVVSGLKEGDQVAMLASATLQAQRQQNLDRMRGMTGGGVPGMQQPRGPGGGGGQPRGGGGPR